MIARAQTNFRVRCDGLMSCPSRSRQPAVCFAAVSAADSRVIEAAIAGGVGTSRGASAPDDLLGKGGLGADHCETDATPPAGRKGRLCRRAGSDLESGANAVGRAVAPYAAGLQRSGNCCQALAFSSCSRAEICRNRSKDSLVRLAWSAVTSRASARRNRAASKRFMASSSAMISPSLCDMPKYSRLMQSLT